MVTVLGLGPIESDDELMWLLDNVTMLSVLLPGRVIDGTEGKLVTFAGTETD